MSVGDIINEAAEEHGLEYVAGEHVDYDGLQSYYENNRCR